MAKLLSRLLLALFLVLTTTSCSFIFIKMMGINKVKLLEEKQIIRTAKHYKIPTIDLYTLDTAYLSMVLNWDSTKYKREIHDRYQPLQALYYKTNGELVSFHVNCYAPGFPNLQWGEDTIFNTFMPAQRV